MLNIESGWEYTPWPGIRQVFWYSICDHERARLSSLQECRFWIEHADGDVEVIRVTGLPYPATTIIPAFTRNGRTTEKSTETCILDLWLFPPAISVFEIADSLLFVTSEAVQDSLIGYEHALLVADSQGSELTKEEVINHLALVSYKFYGNLAKDYLHVRSLLTDAPLLQLATVLNYNNFLAWPIDIRRNRVQAFEVCPLLAPHILSVVFAEQIQCHGIINRNHLHRLIKAIDEGESLVTVMAEIFEVRENTVRRAIGLNIKSKVYTDLFAQLLWLLDSISPDFHPREIDCNQDVLALLLWLDEWGLAQNRNFLKEIAREIFHVGTPLTRRFYRSIVQPHYDDQPFQQLKKFVAHKAWVSSRTNFDGMHLGQTLVQLLNSKKLVDILREAEKFCYQVRHDCLTYQKWPPLTKSLFSLGPHFVVELCDTNALVDEGLEMQNCVGGYTNLCVGGRNFIFSIRRSDGSRACTVHIAIDDEAGILIEQCAGKANQSPSAQSLEGAELLLSYLKKSQHVCEYLRTVISHE